MFLANGADIDGAGAKYCAPTSHEHKRIQTAVGHNMNMNEFMIRNENIMNYIDTNIEKGSQGCIYTN